jgi:hypothetical protein
VEGIIRPNAHGVPRLYKKPLVSIFVRHADGCRLRGKNFTRGCDCPKWLRYSLAGKQYRENANTRSWAVAEDKRAEKQEHLDNPQKIGATSSTFPSTEQRTISQFIDAFIRDKETNNVGRDFIDALRSQLKRFEAFCTEQRKFYPANITKPDISDFRATWATGWQKWKAWSPLKRSKAQTNYRAFLKYCSRGDLLDCFTKIKYNPSKPKPLTAEQVTKLLQQIPKTFAESPEKITRVTAFVKAAISLGPACIDAVLLEREAVQKAANGVVRFERRKTGRIATPRIDQNLRHELLTLRCDSKYLFWDGKGLLDTAVKAWADDIRQLFRDASLYTKGDLTHRFRDTAIDFWFSEGCNSTEVADMAGDTVGILEKHYKDYCSKGRESHIAKLPARSWEQPNV